MPPRLFEDLAIGALAQCHRADANMTQRMLHVKSDLVGNKDCIEVCGLYVSIATLDLATKVQMVFWSSVIP